MLVARNGNRAIDESAHERPNEPWYVLRPASHDLKTEGQRIYIRAIISDDGQREYNQAELSESPETWEQHSPEQATNTRLLIACQVFRSIDRSRGDSQTEHL